MKLGLRLLGVLVLAASTAHAAPTVYPTGVTIYELPPRSVAALFATVPLSVPPAAG